MNVASGAAVTVKELRRREPLGGARFGRGLSHRTIFDRSAALAASDSQQILIRQSR